jgi:hypothetical protein
MSIKDEYALYHHCVLLDHASDLQYMSKVVYSTRLEGIQIGPRSIFPFSAAANGVPYLGP